MHIFNFFNNILIKYNFKNKKNCHKNFIEKNLIKKVKPEKQ